MIDIIIWCEAPDWGDQKTYESRVTPNRSVKSLTYCCSQVYNFQPSLRPPAVQQSGSQYNSLGNPCSPGCQRTSVPVSLCQSQYICIAMPLKGPFSHAPMSCVPRHVTSRSLLYGSSAFHQHAGLGTAQHSLPNPWVLTDGHRGWQTSTTP